jgi:hypothetical protein
VSVQYWMGVMDKPYSGDMIAELEIDRLAPANGCKATNVNPF